MNFLNLATAATLYVLLPGCGGHDHEHGPDGGHEGEGHVHSAILPGGQLSVVEEEFANLEVIHESEPGIARLYLRDGHVTEAVRTTQESLTVTLTVDDQTYTLEAPARENPLSGEKVGDSSEFVLTHESLKGAHEFSGTIASLTMLEKTYTDVAFGFHEPHEEDEEGE